MLKLSNIKVSVRIAVACLLPLLAFTAFAVNELIGKRAVFSTMNQVATVADAAPMISGLINELQRERGTSAGFIQSKGKAFADAMRDQRSKTDKALETWKQRLAEYKTSAAGTTFARNLDAANSRLAEIGRIRSSIDGHAIEGPKAVEFYTAGDLEPHHRRRCDERDERGRQDHPSGGCAGGAHPALGVHRAGTRARRAGFCGGSVHAGGISAVHTGAGAQRLLRRKLPALRNPGAGRFRGQGARGSGPGRDDAACGKWPASRPSTTRWLACRPSNGSIPPPSTWIASAVSEIGSPMISPRR